MSDERTQVQLPLMEAAAKNLGVKALDGEKLNREYSDIILKDELTAAVKRLNPEFDENLTATAVKEIERDLAKVSSDTLVENAQEILIRIKGMGKVKGPDRKSKSVKLIDFRNPNNNTWTVAYEVTYKGSLASSVRFDGVIYCNGIPLVIAEFKSNTDPDASWFTAATDLAEAYTRRAPAFMATALISIASDGRETRYAGVKTPAARYQAWGSTSSLRPASGWEQAKYDWETLTSSETLLAFAEDLILHVTDKTSSSLMRIVPRWPQAEAAPLAAKRALEKDDDRGLFDHFQGSGKTYAMAMAANIITRQDPKHCVILVVDRLDLLSQHRKDFAASDVRRSIVEAEKSSQLRASLKDPTASGIIITTVHRFDDAGFLSDRSGITIMVDEAHRTQEGTLGVQMRQALPNATCLGFTGTPLSDGDKNTYETFGSKKDKGRVIHRYSAADSVKDGTTVPLTVMPREIVQRLSVEELDKAYNDFADKEELSEQEKTELARAVTNPRNLFKDPRRIKLVSEDVAKFMKEEMLPASYAGMLIVIDREACVLYTRALQSLLGEDAVTAVISTLKNDPEDWDEFNRDAGEEATLLKDYRDPTKPLKLLVVTSKLLTGFDAKNCGVVFVEKPLRKHTLFQAVTRANRTWTTPSGAEKAFGTIIDYCGVTPHLIKNFDATDSDPEVTEFTTPEKLRQVLRRSLTAAEKIFGADFDWRSDEMLHNANSILHNDPKIWEIFRKHVIRAGSIWEVLSKDPLVAKEKDRLLVLTRILHSYQPSSNQQAITYAIHGPAVLKLIYANTGDPESKTLDTVFLDAKKIQELLKHKEDPSSKVKRVSYADVLEKIQARLDERVKNTQSGEYRSIAERLEQFKYTHYEVDAEGARAATEDLTNLVRDIREVDRIIGNDDSDLDFEVSGTRIKVHPNAIVNNPSTALQDVLKAYHPTKVATSVKPLSEFLDEVVSRVSYRHLRDDVSAQKTLKKSLVSELARMGLLPKGPDASVFVNKLVDYVNTWMI